MSKTVRKEVPMRRCVGCMESRPKDELIRMLYSQGRLALDPDGKGEGRGVYVCPDGKCINKATRRNAFKRSVRGEVKADDIEAILNELSAYER